MSSITCEWCGRTDCVRRVEHVILNAQRETTWRERAERPMPKREDADVA